MKKCDLFQVYKSGFTLENQCISQYQQAKNEKLYEQNAFDKI